MKWRFVCLCLLCLAGCAFTGYEKELVVRPPEIGESPVETLAAVPSEESWMQFIDFNHIVDSIVELFKHTTAKEAIRAGMHYTERKRFFHLELGPQQDEQP